MPDIPTDPRQNVVADGVSIGASITGNISLRVASA